MSEQTLAISFANQSSDYDCNLLIEQEPWGKDVGETSELQGILGISAAINATRWPEVNCGGFNAEFNATVYVYPCESGLVYQFKVSHGTVSARSGETAYREEIVNCSMELVHTTDYPVHNMGSVSWIGHCYDARGNITTRPTVDITGNVITLDEKVYGSLRVRYTVMRHVYYVTVSERLNSLENTYQSIVYAVWDGGGAWKEIEAPANFDEFAGDCGNGAFYDGSGLQDGYDDGQLSQTNVCSTEYNNLPVAVQANRNITVDYCSQQVTSDNTVETVDEEVIRTECNE